MSKILTDQDYLIIENNIVINNVTWDGDINKWTPPKNSIAVVNKDIPAMIWGFNKTIDDFELQKVIGAGTIGFIWDGSILTTNQPKPVIAIQEAMPNQPSANGTITI